MVDYFEIAHFEMLNFGFGCISKLRCVCSALDLIMNEKKKKKAHTNLYYN